MAGKEWYSEVDPENVEQVREFCERRGYSTEYYILVDFSIPSGKKRFFVYDLQSGRKLMSSYCMHGSGPGNTDAKPKFSNEFGSGCSSLGRYVMVGKGTKRIKNCIRLRGQDKSNSLAQARGILPSRMNGDTHSRSRQQDNSRSRQQDKFCRSRQNRYI